MSVEPAAGRVGARRPARLRTRLLASHVAVVAVGTAVIAAVTRWWLPRLFEERYGAGSRSGRGPQEASRAHAALLASLDRALVVAALVSLAVAGIAAVVVARRIARPLEAMGDATRRIRAGDRAIVLPPAGTAELRRLAEDIASLAAELGSTEVARHRLMTELAHELRTPIATVGGYLEALQDGVVDPTPELFAELVDELGRLRRLTDDLGLMSRLDEGQLELHLAPVDLADCVVAVAERLRPQFDAAGVELEVGSVGGAADATVTADRDRVVQILANLMGNAVRYTSRGGHVDVAVEAHEREVRCIVADDGIGIDPVDLDRVFDRFHRAAGAAAVTGTGVGLTIARSLARAHGGDVRAESPGQGRGATFTLILPRGGRLGPAPTIG